MTRHNKKRKTQHTAALTQAEIWDDSALIRSWNDAVAEYDYYHSIFVSGEDIEAVLDRVEREEAETAAADRNGKAAGDLTTDDGDQEHEDGEVEDGEVGETAEVEGAVGKQQRRREYGRPGAQTVAEYRRTLGEDSKAGVQEEEDAGAGARTDGLTGLVDAGVAADSTLEKVKMSYYWAGYYSGVHDAETRATSQIAQLQRELDLARLELKLTSTMPRTNQIDQEPVNGT